MTDFTSYFDSYARVNPVWESFVAQCNEKNAEPMPGYPKELLDQWKNEDGSPQLIEVSEENYPKIYGALKEECEFRGVPMPACYVDTTGSCSWGWARRHEYAVAVEEGLNEVCTQEELRWIIAHEVKHLYQMDWTTAEEYQLEEFDCDRAAVESTGYDVARSFYHKGAAFKINQKIGFSPLRAAILGVHRAFPNLLSEHFPIAIDASSMDLKHFKIKKDPYHPSPAARMKAMREHAATLERKWEEPALSRENG